MALERKPAEPGTAPEYPDAEAYAADRRKFLGTIGALAVGAAGLWALRKMGGVMAEEGPAPVRLPGEIRAPLPPPPPPPPGAPPRPKGNVPADNAPPARPPVSPKGDMPAPRAEPGAATGGKPMPPKPPANDAAPAQPRAALLGLRAESK